MLLEDDGFILGGVCPATGLSCERLKQSSLLCLTQNSFSSQLDAQP